MRIVYIPRIPINGFETLFAAFLSTIHSFFNNYDIHMIFDSANSPVLFLFRLFHKKCAINPDGLGWKREKWGKLARKYYKWVEPVAARLATYIVTDSQAMREYYENEYKTKSCVIEYGANIPDPVSSIQENKILSQFGLFKHRYILQITRFEPENNPLLTIRAFLKLRPDLKLLIVGSVSKYSNYQNILELEANKSDSILLPGSIYDRTILNVIWQNSLFYVHGNSVGGTNPALLQAMAAGRPIAAIDCVFNRETMGNQGFFFIKNVNSLSLVMKRIIENPKLSDTYARHAFNRIRSHYNWERITNLYEELFLKVE